MITVRYSSIDGASERRTYATIKGAQKFAHHMIGAHPEIGCGYAVSDDGIGKVTVSGSTLVELFPPEESKLNNVFFNPTDAEFEAAMRAEAERDAADMAEAYPAPAPIARNGKCTCSDTQLIHVGCDCAAGDPW